MTTTRVLLLAAAAALAACAAAGPRKEAAFEGKVVGRRFNGFMLSHEGQVVRLSLSLDGRQRQEFEEELGEPDEFNRVVFSVPDDPSEEDGAGNEYLLHLSPDGERRFRYAKGRLTGRFRIFDVNGPHQGWMSVNLRAAY